MSADFLIVRLTRRRYSDKAAFETHKQNPKLAETFKTMDAEGLVAAPPKVFHMHEVLGWLSR